ncbi:MAG: winged helix-turn-helix domain-containing protein [Caulobacter sp.]|nr:winged helix-turn-helix domain-containing protein [Caulobacter sp.]
MRNAPYLFGPYLLDGERRVLLKSGRPLPIGSRAFDLLTALVEAAGDTVSKDALVARVWRDLHIGDDNLRSQIANLRRILGEQADGAPYIVNDIGRGYRFAGPIGAAPSPAAIVSTPLSNLPAKLQRTIGRERAVRAAAQRLGEARLVTLVGPGGIGKTTVAIQAAETLRTAYPDGVCFVDLAPVQSPPLAISAIASALGLPTASEDPTPALTALLRDRHILLVLDNCEHLVGPVAVLVDRLLAGTAGLDILATSREPLRTAGENVQQLGPLTFPPQGQQVDAAHALSYPAVELLVDRVRAGREDFVLSDADAPLAAEICRRLDGLALAIELAAGRVTTFGLRGVAERLDDRFTLLSQGRRTALPRHQTLKATFDWSYDTLSDDERKVFRRLALYAGNFSLESMSSLVADADLASEEAARVLAGLVEKSLVHAEHVDGVTEYRLLETARVYALGRLKDSGELRALARGHAECMLGFFDRAGPELRARPPAPFVATLGRQIGNLRVALDWAFSAEGDRDLSVRLVLAALPVWQSLSLSQEARGRIEATLAIPGVASQRRQAVELHLNLGGAILQTTGWEPRLAVTYAEALRLAEALGDNDYTLRALWGLMITHFTGRNFRAALEAAQRFRALANRLGDVGDTMVGARMMGNIHHVLGEHAQGLREIELMLDLYVENHQRSNASRFQFDQRVAALAFHAAILFVRGRFDKAMASAQTAVDEALALNHIPTLFYGLGFGATFVPLHLGAAEEAERYLRLYLDYTASQIGWSSWAQAYDGAWLIETGRAAEGVPRLREAINALGARALHMHYAGFLAVLGSGYEAVGHGDSALWTLQKAQDEAELHQERWILPEILRRKAGLTQVPPAEAERLLIQAHAMARADEALGWELRCAVDLAGLMQGQGRLGEAHAVLAPTYGALTEGFETRDALAARGLLQSLTEALENVAR